MSQNELVEIRMKLLGASQVSKEGEKAGRGISKVGTSSEKAARKTGVLTRAYRSLGTMAKFAFGAIAVSGVFYLKSAIEKTGELAKTTTGLSRNLGISTQAASRWGAVAQAREIDTKSLNTAFATLSSRAVEAARKGGTLLTPFHQLGISQRELIKHGGDFNWILTRSANALGNEAGGTKRMTAAKALLGKGYQSLLPLFSEGSKGLQEQLHWADKYGVTLDGKTNKSLMEMVQAQRESKVAMLGLKVGLTTALMPAIEGGEGQLQQFIATLNSDKLSGEQKINRIEKQFEDLENFLIKFIADALPKVAENGGKLGVALAGAVWTGFRNSNILGKAVIAAYLFKILGGGGLLKNMLLKRYAENGKLSGKAFTAGVILGTALLGFLLAEALDKKLHWRQWGINAGQNFINALISIINSGIAEINSVLDRSIDVGPIHIHGPHIGEIGEVDFGPGPGSRKVKPGVHIPNPKGITPVPGLPGARGRREFGAFGGSNLRPIHVHTYIDGKEVAVSVAHHAEAAAALA